MEASSVNKSKWMIILFMAGAVLLGILAYMGMSTTSKEHVAKIHQVIQSKGGEVQQIEVVPKDKSPFEQSGKGNTIYKITYLKNGKTLTAWYRSDNYSSIMKEKEEWILPE
ncbi:hypothetical protein [Brevibacillus sp. H7]|uniref:hypothetical protein n=1 Tax=Brevibacillus sp. H7 TaxID=3349138 RepID=UPI003822436C